MKDWRTLTPKEQQEINQMIEQQTLPGHHKNEHNGFEWDEPQYTLNMVQNGHYCCYCWKPGHNCLCSHFN